MWFPQVSSGRPEKSRAERRAWPTHLRGWKARARPATRARLGPEGGALLGRQVGPAETGEEAGHMDQLCSPRPGPALREGIFRGGATRNPASYTHSGDGRNSGAHNGS